MLGCPESPVYLAGKGKRAEAEEVARKLWGPAGASQLGGGSLARSHPCHLICSPPAPPARRLDHLFLTTSRPPPATRPPPLKKAGSGDAKAAEASWTDLFKPELRKGVMIGCMLFVFQQFSGINALIYFSSSVFRQVRGGGGGLGVSAD
jgi:hypothetical protein